MYSFGVVFVPVKMVQSDWLAVLLRFFAHFFLFLMSDSNLPIKMSSGRRLIITNVADDVSFSARRLSFNAKELRV